MSETTSPFLSKVKWSSPSQAERGGGGGTRNAFWVMPCFVFWSERQPNNIDHAYFYRMGVRSYICVHILSDRGVLSNLIGSLSRTIRQYSPPSEWIMCELGVFPIFFLKNDLLKVDKILGLTFFKARKDFKDSKRRFSIYCS